jgi:hypothetical protein
MALMQPHVFQILPRPCINRKGTKPMNYTEIIIDEEDIWPTEGGSLNYLFDGTAVIGWRSIIDWWLDDVIVTGHNNQHGAKLKTWPVELPKSHPIFQAVEKFLMADDGRVAEAIMKAEFAMNESRLFDEGKERAKGIY